MQNLNEDELAHYGVLGMKWGIRRGNYSKAFVKSAHKADRLQARSKKLKEKGERKYLKGTEKKELGWTSGSRRRGARKAARGARKLRKAQRLRLRRERWLKLMQEEFKDISINKIDKESRAKGKNYVHMLKSK